MISIQIKDRPNQPDATTMQRLILPRTMVTTVPFATHGHDDESQHGEASLSSKDRAFIQFQGTRPVAPDARFPLDAALENAALRVPAPQGPGTEKKVLEEVTARGVL